MVVAVLLVMDGPLLTVIMVMTMVFPQHLLLKMSVAAVLVVRVAMIGGCCDAVETQARSKIPCAAQRRSRRIPPQSRCVKRTKPKREAKFIKTAQHQSRWIPHPIPSILQEVKGNNRFFATAPTLNYITN